MDLPSDFQDTLKVFISAVVMLAVVGFGCVVVLDWLFRKIIGFFKRR